MMGLILIGVGLAVPDLPTAIAVALVFGTAVNPFLFLPLAFDPDIGGPALVSLARRRLLPRASAAASSPPRSSAPAEAMPLVGRPPTG